MQKCRKIHKNYRKKTATNKKINLNQYNNIKPKSECRSRIEADRNRSSFPLITASAPIF